jgi:CHAT domain-containing protein
MTNSVRLYIIAAVALPLVACQTTQAPKQTTMSVNEAKTLTADFKVSTYSKLPRDTSKFRSDYKNGGPVPDDCTALRQRRSQNLQGRDGSLHKFFDFRKVQNNDPAYGTPLTGRIKSLSIAAEDSMASGRFEEALERLAHGLSAATLEENIHRLRSQRIRLYAQMGDADKVASEMAEFNPGVWGHDSSTGKVFSNAVLAAKTHLEGNLAAAEFHYREAIYNALVSRAIRAYINIPSLQTGLVQVLLLQGRLTEAEAESRKAIDRMGIVRRAKRASRQVHDTERYTGANAGPFAMLASVFLEQERLDDAEYIARIAVNMHEVGCSDPESLGLNKVRISLISVLAQQEKWQQVLEQVGKARKGLSDYPEIFERLFGSNLDYAEAQMYAGDSKIGHNILEIRSSNKSTSDFEIATIKGLQALSQIHLGNRDAALKKFAEALPDLIRGTNDDDTGGASTLGNIRKSRIFAGYMSALNSLVDEGTLQSAGISIPAELLRIASASRLSRVQQAFSAAHVRAASGDEELSKLVRQEQDLSFETRSISDTLAYLSYSPKAVGDKISIAKLNKRVRHLTLARRTLQTEIKSRFPEFSNFTNPRPMTVTEIARSLKPHQALVSYHVTNDKTYIWALRNNAKLVFSTQDIGKQALFRKIKTLRKAVDPGPLSTLNDIPDFDVVLSNELFRSLLAPVQKGWQGASELLIVPHGPIGALPFSMLATSRDVARVDSGALFSRYKSVAWLAYDTAITQLPSINALKGTRRTSQTIIPPIGLSKTTGDNLKKAAAPPNIPTVVRSPFVGIGDPYFSRKQYRVATSKTVEVATRGLPFRSAPKTRGVNVAELAMLPRLPGTRSEILSIANALGADLSNDILLGEMATEQAVRTRDLSRYNVISFATHGLVPGDLNGLDQPALALTTPALANTDGDGFLSMNEILSLRLDADFAVLSACNTAAADGDGAEAVSGLGRAFFYAGARAILVSNWPVHSAATTDLMSTLFGDLAADKTLTRSEALRQTKLAQINEGGYRDNGKLLFSYAHPIFWAPFSIVGDGGRNRSGS